MKELAARQAGADGWRYRFEDQDGGPLYCCTALGAGRCEPVSCEAGAGAAGPSPLVRHDGPTPPFR